MSIEGGKWTELRWMMITKKRCIVHEGSGHFKVASERSRREVRKHMEVMEHINALGGLEKSTSKEVVTYQTNKCEFPPMQELKGLWESITQRWKMRAWGESIKLIHHYGARLLEWSSIKARMRGSSSDTNKQRSSEHTEFEDDSDNDQQAEQSGAEAEAEGNKGEDNSQKKQKKKRKSKKDKDWEQWNWTLGNINAGDMRKRTSFKWKQLATIMDKNKLDGLAIQEHRLTDDSSFVAEGMGHLRLYLTPCTKGDKGGPAGGVAFLVKAELEQAGLITDHRSITAEGFYGAEEFADAPTLKHKTDTIESLSWDDKWTWKHTLSIILLLYLYLHIAITDQVLAW